MIDHSHSRPRKRSVGHEHVDSPKARPSPSHHPEQRSTVHALGQALGLAQLKHHASDYDLPNRVARPQTLDGSADYDSDFSDDLYDEESLTYADQLVYYMRDPALWASLLYSLCSVSMILSNKLILTTYKFRYPMVLLFHQNATTVLSLMLASKFGIATYEPLKYNKIKDWLPVDVFFVAMLLTSFYSVHLLSVPMVTIFKNTNNIFVAIGDAALYGNVSPPGVVATLALMLVAAIMAGLNDLHYSFKGYVWTMMNCFASTAFVLYARHAMKRTQLSIWGKVFYNNALALPLVLGADFLVFGDFKRLLWEDDDTVDKAWFLELGFLSMFGLSGILGFAQSLASLRCQHLTSPTTYSMIGSLNKIPLSVLGIALFHTPITPKGLIYLALSVLAGCLYSYTKAKEAKRARLKKSRKNSSDTNDSIIDDDDEERGLLSRIRAKDEDLTPTTTGGSSTSTALTQSPSFQTLPERAKRGRHRRPR